MFVQHWYQQNIGKSPVYVPYGANINLNKPEEKNLVKRGLSNGKYILFVGRLVREKGVHYLVEAFKMLKTNYNLVIVGSDPYNKDYELYLKKIANEKTVFLGKVYGKEVETLYSGAYLYVTPSDLEGTSPALLTAMAFGKCVLVSDIPENQETVGDAGFLFKQGDVDDLSQKLNFLIENPTIVEQTGLKAVNRIKTTYNWDLIASQIAKIYAKQFAFTS